ncbi:MAG: hypothetical protein KAR06_01680 [Deltaproteobacteria bacterium]|nr:hypothetical protein [Deltaproteobacteria bacterium]
MAGFIAKALGIDVDNAVNKVHDIVDQKVEDKDLANKLKSALNLAALSHHSVIVTILIAGARPALLWVSVIGLFMNFILNPIMAWFGIPIIELDGSTLATMAGTGGFLSVIRSVEKKLKINKVH